MAGEQLSDNDYITKMFDSAGRLKSFQEYFIKTWMRGTEAEKQLLDIKAFRAMFPLQPEVLQEQADKDFKAFKPMKERI